ncbi:acyl carrier protein [Singulisphaera sp. Ch08]|uniref:Acyl carrier protein n=1 Tax=Singulisphaera sp. Ch08 TaxID=3120278 RepID=A0AAU7CR87_9BACT
MSQPTRASINADVAKILSHFEGREYSGEIDSETRFFADLGLASIDAVVLGEQLQNHYGRPLPFGDLMAALGQRSDRDLRIGELVDFLVKHLVTGTDSTSGSEAD